MSITAEKVASAWRDIVNDTPEEREVYNANSLTDYIDVVMAYYRELIADIDPNNTSDIAQVLAELGNLIDEYQEQCGEMGDIRVQGNGIYIPGESDDFRFLEGTQGISGEFAGFSISNLPAYQDLLYQEGGDYFVEPTLCIELSEFREYTNTGIAFESNGDSVSIPLEGQDLNFTRARETY